MKIMFMLPCVGKRRNEPYVKTWRMEPLSIAMLSALTPRHIERVFFDDRIEDVPYDADVDAVAISVETYTARRAYKIAERFRQRRVPVIMGGFHATLVTSEVQKHADSVMTGNAEDIWPEVCTDLAARRLKPLYVGGDPGFAPVLADRSVYRGKRYTDITLIETGRGCPFSCEFCSISSFFCKRYHSRPIRDVVAEIKALNAKRVFFIDDNIAVDRDRTMELLAAIKPLGIAWCGQVSLSAAADTRLLGLMKQSGCMGVLIGFESLDSGNLETMGKLVNMRIGDYDEAVETIRRHGLGIYATFVFGYDNDTPETFSRTLQFALQRKFFFAAFNHLVPFPGTPLYARLGSEGRLLCNEWWLSGSYRFGDVAFKPKNMDAGELARLCLEHRKKFYSASAIMRRGLDLRANCRSPVMAALYFAQNVIAAGDVDKRQGLVLGEEV
jgi:radical SAM superfamily enzyme YgiQ (UPF0313 family)